MLYIQKVAPSGIFTADIITTHGRYDAVSSRDFQLQDRPFWRQLHKYIHPAVEQLNDQPIQRKHYLYLAEKFGVGVGSFPPELALRSIFSLAFPVTWLTHQGLESPAFLCFGNPMMVGNSGDTLRLETPPDAETLRWLIERHQQMFPHKDLLP